MNVLNSKIEEIKSGAGSFFGLTGVNISGSKVPETKLLKEGWNGNEDVYAVVNRVASLVSTLPIKLMDGEEKAPETDPFYLEFYDNWNSKRGLVGELYLNMVNQLIYGRSYIWKQSESVGYVDNLWTLNTKSITPFQTDYSYVKEPDYFSFNDGSKIKKLYREDLIITDNLSLEESLDSAFISPLQSVFNSVQAGNNRSTAESVMLSNRGIAGFVSPKTASGDAGLLGFMDSTMGLIRKSFATLTGGAEKYNKVEVISQAAEFTQLGMSAGDLKIIEMRLNHVRSICNAYGVPSLLFNDYQSRTHANYETAMKALYTQAIIPAFDKFKNQFEKDYLNGINKATGKNYWLKISLDEIEELNRGIAKTFTSLNPQIAQRFMDKMSEEQIKELMIELGLIK